MRSRVRAALNREVSMPRWAIGLDFFYRAFLIIGAVVVIVLWYQAATRDEEADRNARIQSCSSIYAATYSAWDAAALRLDEQAESVFASIVVRSSADDDLPPSLLADYQSLTDQAARSADKADEMARRRIGLGIYSARSVEVGNDFSCPPIPDDLMVRAIGPP